MSKGEHDKYWYDEASAERAIAFARLCVHVVGDHAGRPFEPTPQQADIIRKLHGDKVWDEGLGEYVRRYQELYILAGRGWGKSMYLAVLELMELFIGPGNAREIYTAGTGSNNAEIIFDRCKAICEQVDAFKAVTTRQTWEIFYKDCKIQYLPANSENQHGHIPAMVVIDDFQEVSEELYNVLRSGTVKRSNSLLVTIGTGGYSRDCIAYKRYEYAKRVASGDIKDEQMLVVINELPEGADWEDESNWHIANPHIGLTISIEKMRREYRNAKENPAYEDTFRALFLCEWTNRVKRWLDMMRWPANNIAKPGEPATTADLKGLKCWGGLDTASKIDLDSLVLVFPQPDSRWAVQSFFWVPKWNLHERQRKRATTIASTLRAELSVLSTRTL